MKPDTAIEIVLDHATRSINAQANGKKRDRAIKALNMVESMLGNSEETDNYGQVIFYTGYKANGKPV